MPSDDFGDNEDFSEALQGNGKERVQADQDIVAQDDADLDLYSGVGDVPDDVDSTAEAGQDSQRQQLQSSSTGPAASQPATSSASRLPLATVKSTAAPAGSSLYIGNLQWWTSDSELESLCSKHGQVLNIKTFEDKTTGKSKGYVLVQFANTDSAAACQAALHSTTINGKACVVTAAGGSRPASSAPNTSAPVASTSGRAPSQVRPVANAQARGNAQRPMADIRWQHANGQMNGHMEPDQFFGGMPGFPNMSMGPQMGMGMGPPMGMGMGMGPMGMGMMNPMAMQMPIMPGMFQPPPPPRDMDRRRPRNDFDDYDGNYKRGRF